MHKRSRHATIFICKYFMLVLVYYIFLTGGWKNLRGFFCSLQLTVGCLVKHVMQDIVRQKKLLSKCFTSIVWYNSLHIKHNNAAKAYDNITKQNSAAKHSIMWLYFNSLLQWLLRLDLTLPKYIFWGYDFTV